MNKTLRGSIVERTAISKYAIAGKRCRATARRSEVRLRRCLRTWNRTMAYCAVITSLDAMKQSATILVRSVPFVVSPETLSLTHCSENSLHEPVPIKSNTCHGEADHDSKMACPGHALKHTILSKASVEDSRDEPCNPEQSTCRFVSDGVQQTVGKTGLKNLQKIIHK